MHDDWHLDRVVSAIRSAAQVPGKPAVANALAAAIAKQEETERAVARKRKQEETEAAHRQEEEGLISGLETELRELRATDPGMTFQTRWNTSLLTLPTALPSIFIAAARKGVSELPGMSPCWSAALGPKGFTSKGLVKTLIPACQPSEDGLGHGPFHLTCPTQLEGRERLFDQQQSWAQTR
jgi:hypothetical protein